jgi:hypothetical protein
MLEIHGRPVEGFYPVDADVQDFREPGLRGVRELMGQAVVVAVVIDDASFGFWEEDGGRF